MEGSGPDARSASALAFADSLGGLLARAEAVAGFWRHRLGASASAASSRSAYRAAIYAKGLKFGLHALCEHFSPLLKRLRAKAAGLPELRRVLLVELAAYRYPDWVAEEYGPCCLRKLLWVRAKIISIVAWSEDPSEEDPARWF